MSELDEVLGEFLVESYENLDRLDQDLVALEDNPDDRQLLGGIFRTIHTIKGTCGFLGFTKLEALTHAGENLLSRLRDGELRLSEARASALLTMVDSVRQILAEIEHNETEGDGDYTALTQHLHQLLHDDSDYNATPDATPDAVVTPTHASDATSVASPAPDEQAASPEPALYGADTHEADTHGGSSFELAEAASDHTFAEPQPQDDTPETAPNSSETAALESTTSEATPGPVPEKSEAQPKPPRRGLITNSPKEPSEMSTPPTPESASQEADRAQEAHQTQQQQQQQPTPQQASPTTRADDATHHSSATDSTLRVDVGLLDTLMNLVGELVLARNQLVQVTATYGENDLVAASQRLNLITTELQEGVMKTRMQPIGNVLGKFPRLVRDVSTQLGKRVRLDLDGKDTELDKTINEAIKDPLTHLVRNSVDHGIETPDVRRAAGKVEEGHVTLRAFHEGGQVNIEIIDDGAGLDANKLKAKAVEKGLITEQVAERLSERDAWQLIFHAGFSTAEKVSNISGRGVGMDVVKTNIESIGGTIDIHSVLGHGTTIRIKIPLTLAIVPAMLVTTHDDRYAIPQVNLLELVRLEGDGIRRAIEMIHGAPVYRLRGELLPLCHLGHELWGESTLPWDGNTEELEALNIVVLQADGRRFGLVVDEINDTQEIVVKPLDQQLKGVGAFAGATTMGDGRVALILDVMGLAQKANVISETADHSLNELDDENAQQQVDLTESLLLVSVGDRRVAVPLSLVARLEDFDPSVTEQSNGRTVVQYRGEIMPLVNVAYTLGAGPSLNDSGSANLRVIVYTSNGRSIGLLVDNILDIVQERITLGDAQPGTGVRGSIVIQDKVTDIIDVVELIRAIDPTFFHEQILETASFSKGSSL